MGAPFLLELRRGELPGRAVLCRGGATGFWHSNRKRGALAKWARLSYWNYAAVNFLVEQSCVGEGQLASGIAIAKSQRLVIRVPPVHQRPGSSANP